MAYFACIKAMSPGFGMDITSEVLRNIQKNQIDAALWLVNEAQASLQRDKMMAEKTVQILETQEYDTLPSIEVKEWMTIGEVSAKTDIPSSAIRHWEKVGLITPSRDASNGYRRFSHSDFIKILLIRTLQTAVYSQEIVTLKQAIKELDHHNAEQTKKIAHDIRNYLNKVNREQLRGLHYLYRLCSVLGVLKA